MTHSKFWGKIKANFPFCFEPRGRSFGVLSAATSQPRQGIGLSAPTSLHFTLLHQTHNFFKAYSGCKTWYIILIRELAYEHPPHFLYSTNSIYSNKISEIYYLRELAYQHPPHSTSLHQTHNFLKYVLYVILIRAYCNLPLSTLIYSTNTIYSTKISEI